MSVATDGAARTVLTSGDGSVEILRSDRDHVSLSLVASVRARLDVASGSRLLCEAVTDQRARHARHVQTAVDGTGPSGGLHLEALRARIGTDVQAITLRRAGSSVMVDLHLMAPTNGT